MILGTGPAAGPLSYAAIKIKVGQAPRALRNQRPMPVNDPGKVPGTARSDDQDDLLDRIEMVRAEELDSGAGPVRRYRPAAAAWSWLAQASSPVHEMGIPLVIAAAATAILWVGTAKLTVGDPAFGNVGDDHVYLYMATHPLGRFHVAPWSWRLLVPALVKILPVSTQTGFEVISAATIGLTGVVTYLVLRCWGFPGGFAILGMLFYFSMSYATRFNIRDFWLTDSAAILFASLGILALQRRRSAIFALLMMLGVLAKESVIFIAPLYYTFEARRRWDARVFARMLVLALPAVAVLIFIHVAIPAWNGHKSYLASMPRLVKLDIQNVVPSYNLMRVASLTLAERAHTPGTSLVYVLTSFGLLGIVFVAMGWRRLRPVLKRFWPFLLLVAAQLLFALNTQRLVVLAFLPVVIACLYGVYEARDRFGIRAGWCLMGVLAAIALELWSPTASSPPPLLQMAALGAIAVPAIFQARRASRASAAASPRADPGDEGGGGTDQTAVDHRPSQ
jgi:hypothetical protein